jgi:hypothetical protein
MLIAPNSVDAFGEQRFATEPSAVRKQELETDKSSPRIVTCRIDDLRQHPSYSRHHLVVPIAKISRLVDQGEQVFREPLTSRVIASSLTAMPAGNWHVISAG